MPNPNGQTFDLPLALVSTLPSPWKPSRGSSPLSQSSLKFSGFHLKKTCANKIRQRNGESMPWINQSSKNGLVEWLFKKDIVGPSLERVTELSTDWFRCWNSGAFGSKVIKCGAGSSFSTRISQFYFWGHGRRIGSRGDAYASFFSIGFPSFEVSGEGDKGEGPSMFYSQPPFVIRNLNSLFLFTIVQCALQLEQPLYV